MSLIKDAETNVNFLPVGFLRRLDPAGVPWLRGMARRNVRITGKGARDTVHYEAECCSTNLLVV